MLRFALICAFLLPASASFAEAGKEEGCGYQGQIAGAVRDARLSGVKERRAEKAILSANPGWPDNYNNAIPLVISWVYQMDKATLKDTDLGAIWTQ